MVGQAIRLSIRDDRQSRVLRGTVPLSISAVRDCIGLDAFAMTNVGDVTFSCGESVSVLVQLFSSQGTILFYNGYFRRFQDLDVEHRARCKSGEWKWVLSRGKVVERDERSKPIRLVGTILDITEHKKNQERIDSLTRALIKAQETERRKLALDLHDEVAQQLAGLTFFLESVRQDASQPEMKEDIAKISRIAQHLVDYVRSLAHALRPPMLDRKGLVPTLSQYCCDYSKANGVKVDFFPIEMNGVSLDFDTEINLFRIAQEALTNARKHAGARTVAIKLKAVLPNIIMSIEDDGKGFDVHRQTRDSDQRKMGLSGMEQRASLLGGRLSIKSVRGKGTKILVQVPLKVDIDEGKEENTHR